jgi:hypothetical protein
MLPLALAQAQTQTPGDTATTETAAPNIAAYAKADAAVVGLRTTVSAEARSAESLGRQRAGSLCRLQDGLPAQVAVLGRAAADMHRLVAGSDMSGVGVGIRIHGDGANAHAPGRRGDAAGYLPPIGDQNLREHGQSSVYGRWCEQGPDAANQRLQEGRQDDP